MSATACSHQKGRPPYRPTKADRRIVHTMITIGFDQNVVCARLGIANKTLRKHYRHELDNAYTTLVLNVRLRIIEKADQGDTQCLIYLNRVLGWNDRPSRTGSNVNVGTGLSLANMDEDAMRAELAEILTTPWDAAVTEGRRRRVA